MATRNEGKVSQRFLSLCGMLAPVLFVGMTILGGAITPGYSHLADTVSELFSPGAAYKRLLDPIHTVFALLLICFGVGILRFVKESGHSARAGITGAWLYIAMGVASVTTATVFPQDAWGSTATFPGEMHIRMSGVVGLLSLLSMLLIGVWFNRTGLYPGFGTYSFVTIALAVISSGFFMASLGGPLMGLTERVTALVGFAWTFTLALWMFSRSGRIEERIDE